MFNNNINIITIHIEIKHITIDFKLNLYEILNDILINIIKKINFYLFK